MDDLQLVLKLKKRLSDAVEQQLEEGRVLKVLHKLSQVPMTIDILQNTQIGKDVNGLRKHTGKVRSESKALVLTWKRLLPSDTTTNNHKPLSSTPTSSISSPHKTTGSHDKLPSMKDHTTEASHSSSKHHKKTKSKNKTDIAKKHNHADSFSQALLGVPGAESNGDTTDCLDMDFPVLSNSITPRIAHKPKLETEERGIKKTIVSKRRTTSLHPTGARRSVSPISTGTGRHSHSPAPAHISSATEATSSKDSILLNPRKRKADVVGSLDIVALTKNSRTQVYSGKKSALGPQLVTSLFDTCIKVLVDNIDLIEEVGGIPFYVLEPVMSKCTASQLMRLEEFNPHFVEDSDGLWGKHCSKEFRGAKLSSRQTWRELYIAELEVRELRLKKLTARISATEKARQEPIRKVISTVATRKPGRKGARGVPFIPGRSVDPLESRIRARPLMKQTMKMAQQRNRMVRFKPSQR